MSRFRIFVSSVQKEFAAERRAVRDFILHDPLLHRFFDVFLFEDVPASSRRADDLYLAEVDASDIYLGLLGNDYGFEDAAGISPTEREFDRAAAMGKTRLVFVQGTDDKLRHPKMRAMVRRVGDQVIRRRFSTLPELQAGLRASMVEFLLGKGMVQDRPFEEQPCPDATMDDLDEPAVAAFVRRARGERQFPLAEGAAVTDVLTHLNLLFNGRPTKAAVLLFGRNPQRFLPSAEVRCMHFHGTEVARPVPFYRIFKGNLFDQVDMAHDFVMSKINRSVGTRAESAEAPVRYEIPSDVVREAIVNAIAHRDYASDAAVQVMVFADRFEVWNPGQLPPPLTPEKLRQPHSSIARNHRLCESLFLARYIEKFGTGTLMMIRECRAHGLPEPDFVQRSDELVATVWRDWLTERFMAELQLTERQRLGIRHLRQAGAMTSRQYQNLTGAPPRTTTRDLDDLVSKGLLHKIGKVGRGTRYVPSEKQPAANRPNQPEPAKPKPAMNRPNRPSAPIHPPPPPGATEAQGVPLAPKPTRSRKGTSRRKTP